MDEIAISLILLNFLVYSHASNDEIINHLRKVELLYPELASEAAELKEEYDSLGGKINKFIKYVEKHWK